MSWWDILNSGFAGDLDKNHSTMGLKFVCLSQRSSKLKIDITVQYDFVQNRIYDVDGGLQRGNLASRSAQ